MNLDWDLRSRVEERHRVYETGVHTRLLALTTVAEAAEGQRDDDRDRPRQDALCRHRILALVEGQEKEALASKGEHTMRCRRSGLQ